MILAICLSLAAAAAYGLSDFLGGVFARRTHFSLIGLMAQLGAMTITWALVAVTRPAFPDDAGLAWAAVAGLGSGIGGLALYRGFSRGEMSVVGPLSGVLAAALPALVGLLDGERFSLLTTLGMLLALPAIWLVATSSDASSQSHSRLVDGVLDGIVAGVAFGILFIGLARAGNDAGVYPPAVACTVGLLPAVAAVWFSARRAPLDRSARELRLGLIPGVLAGVSSAAFQWATRDGGVAIPAVLTSLYPGFTVLLATLVLHERLSKAQQVGLALCAAAVVAIVLG